MSGGIIFFTVLFAMLVILGLSGDYESFTSVYKIPAPYISIWFWVTKIIDIIGLFSIIGLLLLKDVFRKIIIGVVCFDLVRFILESPFINKPDTTLIIGIIINIAYDIAIIYFFTRPKVKDRFK